MPALDWIFTDEHRAFRQAMRTLVARDVAPHAAAVDEAEAYPWDAIRC